MWVDDGVQLALVTMEVCFQNSAQDVLKLVIDGDYILKKKKDMNRSTAWQQFQ